VNYNITLNLFLNKLKY